MKKMQAIVILAFSAGAAFAHSGATGIVKERMDAMKEIGSATKALAKLDWNDVGAARASAVSNSQVLQRHAADIVRMFPPDSNTGPSEAIPAIWEKPDDFADLAKALETAAGAMIAAADTATKRDDVAAPFQAIADTCKACHADFRKKK